jgi:nitrile hydratase
MDTIHDMGGMHGFGPVEVEENEPFFHAGWERRVFALASAIPFAMSTSDDHFRPAIERIAPERYLNTSYYEKWLDAIIAMLKERGYMTDEELAGGVINPVPAEKIAMVARPGDVVPAIFGGASQSRPADGVAKRFAPGDRIVTKRHGARGHTRLPRYARGKPGRIAAVHGAFLVADLNAEGDQTPEMLYTVVFDACDIWGPEAQAGDSLTLDLWDRYLDKA